MPWGRVFAALPTDLTREETLFFDAVDQLVPACQLQYSRIRTVGTHYAELNDRLNQGSETDDLLRDGLGDTQTILFADAHSFVATIQRLRKVVNRLRGDATIRMAKKAFDSAISANEAARHYLEHLDTAIPRIVPTGHGAVGSMAWFYVQAEGQFRLQFIIPGHLGKGATAGIRMPGSVRPPVDHFWITIAGADYYLTGAADAVDALRERLAAWSAKWLTE